MINEKISRLVGIKEEKLKEYLRTNQIQLKEARLIPLLKTGDEMALTSIFLSSIRLVKEFRESLFKDIKMSRGGKFLYFTEVCFPAIKSSRVDGLLVQIKGGKIVDAAFFEMKNKSNPIDPTQISDYVELAKTLKIPKIITVSNQFVADPTLSPIQIKTPKSVNLFHFSWTYLLTKGRLLLYKNAQNIEDADQVEIMREVLYYFEGKESGIQGYTQMKPAWKELAECIRAHKKIKVSDPIVQEAVLSWYEEEKDMALMLSRALGEMVKSTARSKGSLKEDVKKLVMTNNVFSTLSIRNSVSDVKIKVDFEKRNVLMSVKVNPPEDKGNIGKVTWLYKQLESAKNKKEILFPKILSKLYVTANIKYAREGVTQKLTEINALKDVPKTSSIKDFEVKIIKEFGASFTSQKKFVKEIELLLLHFYEGCVQHLSNWTRPAPKVERPAQVAVLGEVGAEAIVDSGRKLEG